MEPLQYTRPEKDNSELPSDLLVGEVTGHLQNPSALPRIVVAGLFPLLHLLFDLLHKARNLGFCDTKLDTKPMQTTRQHPSHHNAGQEPLEAGHNTCPARQGSLCPSTLHAHILQGACHEVHSLLKVGLGPSAIGKRLNEVKPFVVLAVVVATIEHPLQVHRERCSFWCCSGAEDWVIVVPLVDQSHDVFCLVEGWWCAIPYD